MHILLIHQFYLEDDQGGGSRWNEMTRMWIKAGHRVTVIAGMGSYMDTTSAWSGRYFTHTCTLDHVEVIRCFVSRSYHSGFWGRLLAYFSFTFYATLGGLSYAREKYDLVLVSSPPLFIGITGLILSWKKRIPLVFEVRDLWPESAVEMGILHNKVLIGLACWLERLIYRKAERIVVLTPAFRDILMDKKGLADKKIMVIPNGADFRLSAGLMHMDVEDFRRLHGLEGHFVITYVGAHGVANNLSQILDAATLLKDTNVIFLLVGGGPERDDLIKQAVDRGLTQVRFLGVLPKGEVFKFILASDAGISILKKTEIFKTIYSNKTFDYFSCKKPVLMGIDGISKTLVEDAKAGLFIQPGNAHDFAEKIRYYLYNPNIVRQHGENGYFYARAHFDREALAHKYLVLLQSLSAKRSESRMKRFFALSL
jgi:glycosyltransferase involved in cell wall biosynthesis